MGPPRLSRLGQHAARPDPRTRPPTADTLLLSGHNPGLEDLVLLLVPDRAGDALRDEVEAKFPTASLAVMTCEGDNWGAVMAGTVHAGGVHAAARSRPGLGPGRGLSVAASTGSSWPNVKLPRLPYLTNSCGDHSTDWRRRVVGASEPPTATVAGQRWSSRYLRTSAFRSLISTDAPEIYREGDMLESALIAEALRTGRIRRRSSHDAF